jgi:hypothetical protein
MEKKKTSHYPIYHEKENRRRAEDFRIQKVVKKKKSPSMKHSKSDLKIAAKHMKMHGG